MRSIRAALALALVSLAVGCDRTEQVEASKELASEGQGSLLTGGSQGGELYAIARPDPSPIPFGEIFSMQVEIREGSADGPLSQNASLSEVRAVMPAHSHGMKVEPTIESRAQGRFLVDGMNFHMRGEGEDGLWVLEFVVQRGPAIEVIKIPVQCCQG